MIPRRPCLVPALGAGGAWLCVLLALALAGIGCGGGRSAPNAQPTTHFGALGKTSSTYHTQPSRGAALKGPHAASVGRAVEQALQRSGVRIEPDARLAELGAWIARSLDAQSAPPPAPVIDLWARQLGLVEPTPHLIILGDGSENGLQTRLGAELEAATRQQRYSHYGVATMDRDGAAFAVLVLSFRWVELQPLPREVKAGASLQLSGKLLGGLREAQLVVSYPDGKSQRSPSQKGTRVALPVPLRGRGEHRVELLAESDLGITVVANFPVYVGVPATQTIRVTHDTAAPASEAEAQERLLALIAQERQRSGVAPLTHDPALDRVARAHSEDMAAHGFVGHTSPTTGGAEQRVKRAGMRTTLVLENIGRGYSPDEVHRGLMDSPGHRANVVYPSATHVGIGLVLEREDDRSVYLVTQLFVRLARKIDVADATGELRDAIDRARARKRAPELEHDGKLSELCAEAARSYFAAGGQTSREQLLDRLNRKAAAVGARYRRMAAVITVVSSVEDAADSQALLDPRARGLGLGLAQGTRPDSVENAIAVVGLVGY